MRPRYRHGALFFLTLTVGLSVGCTREEPPAAKDAATVSQTEKKEHLFKGRVEAIDAAAKTLTVNGENVEGWMGAMTMVYRPDKEDVFRTVKTGDQITAKVYDGDFQTLHDVQITNPK